MPIHWIFMNHRYVFFFEIIQMCQGRSTPHIGDKLIAPLMTGILIMGTMGPPKPTVLEVFMVNNLVFRWPKPLLFMVLGAHGI